MVVVCVGFLLGVVGSWDAVHGRVRDLAWSMGCCEVGWGGGIGAEGGGRGCQCVGFGCG